jgi:AAA+ superfamily predicted ATPase
MILIINRIISLDAAIQSRIHLAIRYYDLTQQQKIEIFNIFLDQLQLEEHNIEKMKEWIRESGSAYELNGRQIRNVVSSAWALAHSRGEKLSHEHLKRAIDITRKFQKQLEPLTVRVRGQNERTKLKV